MADDDFGDVEPVQAAAPAKSAPGPNGATPIPISVDVKEPDGTPAPVPPVADEFGDVEPIQAAPTPAPQAGGSFQSVTDADFTPASEASFQAEEQARVPESTKALRHLQEVKTPFDDARQQRAKASYLSYVGAHQDASPEQRAQTLELMAKYDLPADMVEAQRDRLLKGATRTELLEAMARSPALVRFLNDGVKAPLVKDDLNAVTNMGAALKGHFDAWDSMSNAFNQSWEEPTQWALSAKQLFGLASQQDLDKLDLMDAEKAVHGDYGAETLPQKVAVGLAGSVPTLTGFVGAGLLGAPGVFAFGMLQNAGPAFRSLKSLQGQDGGPLLDDAQARRYALAASTIGSLIFALPGSKAAGRVLQKLPEANKLMTQLGTDVVSKVLQRPGLTASLGRFAMRLGLRGAEGGLLMASQAAANAGAAEVAKSENGEKADWSNVSRAGVDAFLNGVTTFAPLTLFGAGKDFLHDLGFAKALQDNTLRLDMFADAASKSKLLERSPAEFENFVRLNQTDKPNVYIDRAAWDEHFTKNGEDPAAKAADVLGDGGKAYLEAQSTGGDLVIPVEKYGSRLNQEHTKGLREVARFEADQPSIREQLQEAERLKAVAAETDAGPKDTAHEVAADIEAKAIASGTADPALAKATGAIWGAAFRRLGETTGMDAKAAYDKLVNVSIQRGEGSAEEPQARAAQLSQADKEHPVLTQNRAAFSALPEEQQLRAYYEEPVTGLLNERGFNALPTEGKPLVGHISVEGIKFRNDKVGHEHADQLYRAVAEALHEEAPDAAKVGGDFAVRISSNKELKALIERVKARLPEEAKGFELVARAGEDFKSAGKLSGEYKAEGEAKGVRAERGTRPKVFATDEEALRGIPSKRIDGADLNPALRDAFSKLTPDERFRGVHVEEETGLLTKAGFDARPPQKFRASIDLNGLKALNKNVSEAFGDHMLESFGRLGKRAGGLDFDLAHDHGDEYLAQSDDHAQLSAFMDRLTREGEEAEISARDASGGIYTYKGLRFGYGIGEDAASADVGLNAHKQRLTEEGKRGDELQRLTYSEAGREADTGLDQAPRRDNLGAGNDVTGEGRSNGSRAGEEPAREENGQVATLDGDTTVRLEKDGDRGYVVFEPGGSGKPRRFDIHILEQGDASTLAHESMHVFAELLHELAQKPDTSEALKADSAVLLKAQGYTSHEERNAEFTERRQLAKRKNTEDNLTPEESARLTKLTAKEEFVTHAWEQYLLEGKAPTAELSKPFARFKRWLTQVYRGVAAIGRGFQEKFGEPLKLSDDVRGVFDRLLTSEDEVRKAQAAEVAQPFTEAQAHMSPAELAEYADATDKARAVAEQQMLERITRGEREENNAFMRSERERISGEVNAELDQNPVYSTLKMLQEEDPLGGEPLKLNREALVRKYDPDFVRSMPRGIFGKKGEGISAEELAVRSGWDDGDAMVRALKKSQPRAQVLAAEVQQRLEAQHGPALLDNGPWLAEQALESTHNPAAAKKAVFELNALRRALKKGAEDAMSPDAAALRKTREGMAEEKASAAREATAARADAAEAARIQRSLRNVLRNGISYEAMKATAREVVGGKSVGELTAGEQGLSGGYLRAERKAARESTNAAAKGDYLTAIAWKEKQLLNMAMFREAADLRAELERASEKLKRAGTDDWRAYLGKADPAYRDAHDAILQAVGLQESGPGQPVPSIDPLVTKATADAQDLDFDVEGLKSILSAKTPWDSLTVDQARNVMDAVTNLRTAARETTTLLLDGKRVSREALFNEMALAASKRPAQPLAPRDASMTGALDDGRKLLQSLDAQLLTPESLVSMLDGHKKDGPFRRAILDTEKASRDAELALKREFLPKVVDAFNKLPKDLREKNAELVDLSSELPLPDDLKDVLGDGPVSRTYLWMLALNMGNDGNKQRLLDGYGWTEDQVMGALNRRLSKAEWDFVQNTWDTLEGLYPKIADVHEQATGLRPGKVVATPVKTPHGEYKGGYFPAREDPRAKTTPVRQNPESIADMFGEEYRRPSVKTGHAKARTERADYVVNLSWSVVPSHLAQVVHDVAYRPFIRQTAQFMLDQRFTQLTEKYLGTQRAKQFVPWLQAVANNQAESVPGHLQGAQKVLGWVRGRAARQLMGGNLASMAKHFLDPLNAGAAGLTKPGDIAMAQVRATNPKTWKPMADFALASSKELQARQDHMTREVERQLKEIGEKSKGKLGAARDSVARGAEHLLGGFHEQMDRYVTTVTWTAAYTQAQREALALGYTPEEAHAGAVKQADDVVRKVYPSPEVAQMAAALRNKSFLGTCLMFAGFMNKTWNLKRQAMDRLHLDVSGDASGGDKAKAIASFTGKLLALAALGVGGKFLGAQGKKDDESQKEFLGRTMLADPFADTPILGTVAEHVADLAVKGKAEKMDFRASPVADFASELWEKATKSHENEQADQKLERYIESLLTLSVAGSGAVQAHRTLDYARQLQSGEAQPRGALDIASGLIYGKHQGQGQNPLNATEDVVSQ